MPTELPPTVVTCLLVPRDLERGWADRYCRLRPGEGLSLRREIGHPADSTLVVAQSRFVDVAMLGSEAAALIAPHMDAGWAYVGEVLDMETVILRTPEGYRRMTCWLARCEPVLPGTDEADVPQKKEVLACACSTPSSCVGESKT